MRPRIAAVGFLASDAALRAPKRGGSPYLDARIGVTGLERADGDKPPVTYLRVTVFGDGGELAQLAARLRKGVDAYVAGTLQVGVWTDGDGHPRASVSVIAAELRPLGVLEGPDERPASARLGASAADGTPKRRGDLGVEDRFDDGDIPF